MSFAQQHWLCCNAEQQWLQSNALFEQATANWMSAYERVSAAVARVGGRVVREEEEQHELMKCMAVSGNTSDVDSSSGALITQSTDNVTAEIDQEND